MIWNEKYETMKSVDMKKHQSDKLVSLINKVYDKVPFYKEKMDKAGVKPSDIKKIGRASCRERV